MTALTQNSIRPSRDGRVVVVPLAANTTVYQGSIVEINSDGRAIRATKGVSKNYMGVALTYAKTGATAGEQSVSVERQQTLLMTTTGPAPKVGRDVYLEDDNTVTITFTGATKLGSVVAVESGGVWVSLD